MGVFTHFSKRLFLKKLQYFGCKNGKLLKIFLGTNTLFTLVFVEKKNVLSLFSAPTKLDDRNFYHKNYKKPQIKRLRQWTWVFQKKLFFVLKLCKQPNSVKKWLQKVLNLTRTHCGNFSWSYTIVAFFAFFCYYTQNLPCLSEKKAKPTMFWRLRIGH